MVVRVRAERLVRFGAESDQDVVGGEASNSPEPMTSGSGHWDAIPWHGPDGPGGPMLPEMLSVRWVREAKRRALTSRSGFRARRAGARVVSMASATERRSFMRGCLQELEEVGVDCGFRDAINGRELGLVEAQLMGDVHHLTVEGSMFTIDTSAWPRRGWTEEMLREVQNRFQHMRFFPHYWTAIYQNIQDRQTLGFIGGHMSHVGIWREARDKDWDWVFIMEDDALPAPTLGLSWADIWHIVAHEIECLARGEEPWDILYVGRTLSMTPEGRRISGLLCEPGYCLRTHSYCLSRRGYTRLLDSGVANTVLHCPQDEVFATLWIGDHVHTPTRDRIAAIRPRDGWRALAVRWRGLTAQLIDVERTERAASQAAKHSHE